MPLRNRLSALLGPILFGLTLLPIVELPAQTRIVTVLGWPLAVQLSGRWLLITLLVGMACTGTEAVLRAHPLAGDGSGRHTFVSWALPGLLILTAALLLPLAPDPRYWPGGLALTGLLLGLTVAGQYHTFDPAATHRSLIRAGLRAMAYVTALTLFTLIGYTHDLSSVVGTAAVGGLLALELLREQSWRPMGLYAGLTGLILGAMAWAMNYLGLNSLRSGLLLLLAFHTVTGLARQHLDDRLSQRAAAEYAVVALIVLALIIRLRV